MLLTVRDISLRANVPQHALNDWAFKSLIKKVMIGDLARYEVSETLLIALRSYGKAVKHGMYLARKAKKGKHE